MDLFEKVALLTEAAAVLVHHLHVFMCMQRHHIEHVHESVHAVQYNVRAYTVQDSMLHETTSCRARACML